MLLQQSQVFDMELANATTEHHLRNDLRALNLLEHGPLSAAVIADRLHLTRAASLHSSTAWKPITSLAVPPDPTDRRVVMVELQQPTWAALAKIYRPLGRKVHAATADLEPYEHQRLTALLDTLTIAFTEARSRHDDARS